MFTCISCRIAFETAEEQRSHFGTDWHRYNMKRRVANLPPVAASAFNDKVIERREQNAVRPDPKDMTCTACNKAFSTENSYRSHVQSKKHRERVATLARPTPVQSTQDDQPVASASASNGSYAQQVEDDIIVDDTNSDNDNDDEDDDEHDIEQAIAASRRRFGLNDCLFCAHKSNDIDANVSHMSSVHSFFIPDQDLLIDLGGLIGYLGEKVAGGNLCLFCPNGGKEFGSLDAVRKHMVDKSHCKLAYETDEDRAELADFYDFAGVDSEWEDVDNGNDSDYDAEVWSHDVSNVTDVESAVPSLAADGLSLVLPSGRVLGHRALKVYYSQRLKSLSSDPADPIQSKVALVRQRLADPSAALVPVAGGHGGFGKGLEVMKARNAGEAAWAKKQGSAFKDQRTREAHKTKVGFRNNNQKHFRDPLLQ